jgi:membrane-associated phospholipid phosphatase
MRRAARSSILAGAMRVRRAELWLFLAAYVIYDVVRWLFAGDPVHARANAHWILALERSAHLAVEAPLQRALGSGVWGWLLSNVYMAAQVVVLPVTLIWLYRRSRPLYRRLRDTVLVTWLLSVPVYVLFPVAPPRLAGIGMADTVSRHAAIALSGRSTDFYNPFAAVPSLHVGFAFAIALAVAAALRRRALKALALLWGPLVALAVVATGNHFVFDIVAGLVATGAGFAAGRLLAGGPVAAR